MKRSTGEISPLEFKRRSIINEINHIAFSFDKSQNSSIETTDFEFSCHTDKIVHMELDPIESKWLLTLRKNYYLIIYDVSKELDEFKLIKRFHIPHKIKENFEPPHSVHWLWDNSIITIGLRNCIQFLDVTTFNIIETIDMPTITMNHIIAANQYSSKKYVVGMGQVFIIDIRNGTIVMTFKHDKLDPSFRVICWNPNNELQYITGLNENIYLWDFRFHKKYILKYNDSFYTKPSHSSKVASVHFYNNGNNIISMAELGDIKTWETNSGRLLPNVYQRVLPCLNYNGNYQSAVTDHLKEDIAFLPTRNGIRMIDIVNVNTLPNSIDTSYPVHCATFDSKNSFVYGSTNNLVKLWTPQFQSINSNANSNANEYNFEM